MKVEDEEKVEQDEEKITAADQQQLDQEPAERDGHSNGVRGRAATGG